MPAGPDPMCIVDAVESQYAEHLKTQLRRVEAALAACEFDELIIFAGGERSPPRDDVAYPYRPEPYFAAFVPLLEHPGSALKLTPGRRPRLLYHQPVDFWHAPPQDPAGHWVEHFDIEVTRTAAETGAAMGQLSPRTAVIGDPGTVDTGAAAIDDARLLAALDYQRACKTDYEAACLAYANRIAARGHRAVAAAAGSGESELGLHRRYLAVTGEREPQLPYPNIIALNEHAAILHYQRLETEAPAQYRSLLIDAGATCNGYAADVTRTYAAAGGRFAELIAAMDGLQQELVALAVAGTDFVALDDTAHTKLAGLLVEHGLVRCTAEAACESGLTRIFLPHGLGHLLGLQVHDAGGHQISPDGERRPPPQRSPFLRLTRVLEPGFAITIEPGLYWIPSLLRGISTTLHELVAWPVVEALMPYGGIRIEDDILIRSTGSENLTRNGLRTVQTEHPM